MPKTPKRPCRYPGCPNLCENGIYCEEHQKNGAMTPFAAARLPEGMTHTGERHEKRFCPGIRCAPNA